jgi:uncharacterized damage-inducible protein DinB
MLPEIQQYLTDLDDLRGQVAAMIKDLPAEALNWRPPLPAGADPTNSLAVLAVHIAGSEHFWIAECIGQYAHTRVRAEEFAYVASSATDALARLDKTAEETRSVLGKLTPEQLEGTFLRDDHPVSVRWAIVHTIKHISLHIGHMQLTYQLWNKGKAFS